MRLGFDVSQFNDPAKVPWKAARFACVRATTGVKLDTLADEHLRRASGNGVTDLLVYAYLKGSLLGEVQARALLDRAFALEDVEHVGPLALGVDIEDPLEGPPWHRPTYAKALHDFADYLTAHTGRACILYTSPGYIAQLAPSALVQAMSLWLADWTPPADLPKPWRRWTIWQNAVKPATPGGPPIDHDLFDGTAEDWRRVFFPDHHDEIGPMVTTMQQASGHGPGGVEDFRSYPEGPPFDPT
jgi:GH25 family lysozyme M1 (1,4-beta-N-acetylmuramidase)